jgi:hypothetical protein
MFFDCEISKNLKETMLKIRKDDLKVITERTWVLSWYMPSPDRKYLRGLTEFYPLIRGQPLYDQSTSPCKSVRLNGEYRYLQLLLPQNTYHRYIFACVCQKIKSKGGEPLTFNRPMAKEGVL